MRLLLLLYVCRTYLLPPEKGNPHVRLLNIIKTNRIIICMNMTFILFFLLCIAKYFMWFEVLSSLHTCRLSLVLLHVHETTFMRLLLFFLFSRIKANKIKIYHVLSIHNNYYIDSVIILLLLWVSVFQWMQRTRRWRLRTNFMAL